MKPFHILLAFSLVVWAVTLPATTPAVLHADLGLFMPGDTNYRTIYGSGLSLSLGLSYAVAPDWHIWLNWTSASGSGIIPEINEAAQANQTQWCAGVARDFALDPHWAIQLRAGLGNLGGSEETMGEEVSRSGIGFFLGAQGRCYIQPKWFIYATAGLSSASVTEGGLTSKLGGVRFGLGAGVHL